MTSSTISIFLPVFFAALVVCGIVLCTCAYCHRPNFFVHLQSGDLDPEKQGAPTGHITDIEHVHVGGSDSPPPVEHVHHNSGGPEVFDVEEAEPAEASVIDIVEAHPEH